MELSISIIQKYKAIPIGKLDKLATSQFNKFIRLRDCNENGYGICISSGRPLSYRQSQAGHFYSAGHYFILKFNEDNVHAQSMSDNYFKSGNLVEYRKNLIKKIGIERVEKLDLLASMSKRQNNYKDRFTLIEIIEIYKEKVKKISKTKMFKI